MQEHEALLKAQNEVRPPKKYRDHWIVKYRKEGTYVSERFYTEEGAYEFFYKKLREIKAAILSNSENQEKQK